MNTLTWITLPFFYITIGQGKAFENLEPKKKGRGEGQLEEWIAQEGPEVALEGQVLGRKFQ